jgi:plastocyanin
VRRGAAAAVAALIALAACGDDGGGGGYEQPSGPAQESVVVEGGNFFFDPDEPTLSAGVNELELVSVSGFHTLLVEGVDGFKLEVNDGERDTLKLDLRPGDYTFFCDVPAHRPAGMEGTITVT